MIREAACSAVAARSLRGGILAVARRVTVTVLTGAVFAGCGGAAPPKATLPPSPSPTVSLPYPQPPQGGEVEVVEQGFSITHDHAEENRHASVTFAAILKNTSELVAQAVQVRIRVLNRSGKPLGIGTGMTDTGESGTTGTLQVAYILPGERLGVSGGGYTDPYDAARTAAKLEVSVEKPDRWWPRRNEQFCFPASKATDVRLAARVGETAMVTFNVEIEDNLYDGHHVGDVVFRDRRGRIVGGGFVSDVEPSRAGGGTAKLSWGIPLQFDPSKTEFYVRSGLRPMGCSGR